MISLTIDDSRTIGAVDTPGVLKRQPQEDFCVGHDNRNPLDEKAPPGQYGGKLTNLRVVIEKQ